MRREYGTGTVFRAGKTWYVKIWLHGRRVTRIAEEGDLALVMEIPGCP